MGEPQADQPLHHRPPETEYRSIAGDGTPYVFTDKEVRC